ncbi:hypothetical protein Tdes44962_MAKER07273 [Teratosphaeria destructans]|uniref:Uncharacterized protein n=1 Tax=Teratosphaeria destructans TaxID=418781 RepID=A0A9W7SZN1_9PEZI|nr:hypothetical protein Tdes44962_MAKER07273 [Teratosphaeria destructans]
MELHKFEISDSKLEHNNWHFPTTIRTRPLRELDEEDFLVNHKIDRSYDDSTVRFKLLVGNAIKANLEDNANLPFKQDVLKVVKQQGWVADEYEHLWRRDGGGSASFLLQTPRDGKSFCSLSLVNRERTHCGGLYIADDTYSLDRLLAAQQYQNRHPKVPRDFSILPITVLVHHIDETLSYVQRLAREVTSTEKRIADGDIRLEDNGDYKLLNRLNLEHIRLERRARFEAELGQNLLKYIDEYYRMWIALWEGGTSYIEDMREKIEQQSRYSEQVQRDLEILPRRIKNQSKAISNYVIQRDNKLNIQLAESNKRIAEEARRDNLLNLEMAAATAQVAEETRVDSAAMKTIAVLTLTFLPGTFVASFFSIQMFQWDIPDGSSVSPYLWVYFVVTIPLTIVVYLLWVWWFKHSQRNYKKNHDASVMKFEQELKSRVRSATGTW